MKQERELLEEFTEELRIIQNQLILFNFDYPLQMPWHLSTYTQKSGKVENRLSKYLGLSF